MIVEIARVVIEFSSPVAIGRGVGDDLLDALVIQDADGLPALPGSTVAGVLRASPRLSEESRRRWFGYAEKDTSAASQLWVSWGRPHNGADQPVAPKLFGVNHDDDVLMFLKQTVVRDRVRINGSGVVDGTGKFDQSFLPAGARFTLEFRSDSTELPLSDVLTWLDGCSVGAGSRSGFGRLKVVRAELRRFDLKTDAAAWKLARRPLWEVIPSAAGFHAWKPEESDEPALEERVFRVTLAPEHGLLIGGGLPADHLDEPDLVYFTEDRIEWQGNRGSKMSLPILPGTALRGALRHRTAFHLRRTLADEEEVLSSLRALFGSDPSAKGDLCAGTIRVPEVVLPTGPSLDQHHVAIDRFTQGARDGMLFYERALWLHEKVVELQITIETPAEATAWHDKAVGAFRWALTDLCEGTLGLGHGNSRGHGFFTGSFAETP